MHVLALPLALSITFAAPRALSNDGASAEANSADIARFVDLRAFDLLCAGRSEEMEPFPVVPLLQVLPPAAGDVDQGGFDEEWRPSEAAFGVFSELHGDAITSADFVEPGVLYMEATEEGHEAFARFVERLESLHTAAPRLRVTRFAAEAKQLAAARAAGGDAGALSRGRGWRAPERSRSLRPDHPRPRTRGPLRHGRPRCGDRPGVAVGNRWSSTRPRGWTSRSSAAGPATRCVSPTSPARPNVRTASSSARPICT